MLIARPVDRRFGPGLNRVDMRYLQAGVVGRQSYVGAADKGQLELKLDLARPYVRERRGVVERRDHPVAVAYGDNVDRRRQGWALVDDDLAGRTRVRRQRRDAPSIHGDALRALCKEEVDDVLDVLVVDQVAGLPAGGRSRYAVGQVDGYAWAAHGGQTGVCAEIRDLVLQGLRRRRTTRSV